MKSWDYLESEAPADYRIFKIRTDLARSPRTGALHRFSIMEAPDWVNVIARTEEGLFVMVRQVRHALRRGMVEIPGGMVDPGESPDDTALRELLEETGYSPQSWRKLAQVHPNPAIQTNTCHLYLADRCRQLQEPQLDGGEDIAVELWTHEQVLGAIRSGEISHALVIAAFFYFQGQRL